MLTAGKSVLGIVSGGIALGVLLGGFAHPVMKEPAEPSWQLGGRPEFTATASYEWVEAGPEDLSVADGYRPDLDYDAYVGADWTPPPYGAWALDESGAVADAPSPEPGVVDTAATAAGDRAEQAAEDAQAAQAQPVMDKNSEPRLADAGLPALW